MVVKHENYGDHDLPGWEQKTWNQGLMTAWTTPVRLDIQSSSCANLSYMRTCYDIIMTLKFAVTHEPSNKTQHTIHLESFQMIFSSCKWLEMMLTKHFQLAHWCNYGFGKVIVNDAWLWLFLFVIFQIWFFFVLVVILLSLDKEQVRFSQKLRLHLLLWARPSTRRLWFHNSAFGIAHKTYLKYQKMHLF